MNCVLVDYVLRTDGYIDAIILLFIFRSAFFLATDGKQTSINVNHQKNKVNIALVLFSLTLQ